MSDAQRPDPRIPPRTQVVQRYVLDHFAETQPDTVFLVDAASDRTWTYAQLRDDVRRMAAGLKALGVEQGEHVASFLPNSLDAAFVWMGLNYLGAVYVPLNPAYRGRMLEHTIDTSDARLLIAHAGLVERLRDVELGSLKDLVQLHGNAGPVDGLTEHPPEILEQSGDDPGETARPIEPWDTQGIWYTSGTTGPSKAVLSSYMHAYSMFGPETWPFITAEDRWMVNLPLFHMGGTAMWNMMLLRGGSVAFVEKFRTPDFWPSVRRTGSTGVFLLGTMAAFLESQPETPEDADHPMRLMFMVPVVDDVPGFARRFGVEVRSVYNMSELCMPVFTGPTPDIPGVAGRVRPGVEVRLVDDNDCEVPHGTVGEFVVRSETPWSMNHGYYKMPEATARAWRNGWFHTGDFGRRDEDGNFWFVDRKKDAVRRRGEFVSSLELEIELCVHPAVSTAAILGIPNEYAEEDVMAVLKPAEGATIDPAELVEWLRPRVAHFMVPRYIRVMEELPMTPTEKVRKVVLREEGVTPDTWDREAAGIVVRPDVITSSR
jgi:carnitine-CoA ligase